MKIHYLGATRTTTGSMFLLEVNQRKILIDCGLYQGKRMQAIERNQHFPFDPAGLDAVLLSHAHIDHCGNLPNLGKQGFQGNIYCTFGTRDLVNIMLEDSGRIQESDARYISKQRAKKGLPPIEPLYTASDAERVTRQIIAVGYERPLPVTDGVTVTFYDAGHILGAAQVALDIRENGRIFRYLYSGDVGRGGDPILRDPQPVAKVDFLQIESTYGMREHGPKNVPRQDVREQALETFRKGGKVIIPSFAVGRTQQVVYALNNLIRENTIPAVPIFVDSPLAVNATEVHRLHSECFNAEIYEFLRQEGNPFEMENLTYIRMAAHSKQLNEFKGPAIIISASGMAEAGRILHHLRNNLGDPKNMVLFAGYCAENTLGAYLRAGMSPVKIFDDPCEVRARIAAVDSFSGHADKNELVEHVNRLSGSMQKIIVAHGEEGQSLGFAEILKTVKPHADIVVPVPGQTVEI